MRLNHLTIGQRIAMALALPLLGFLFFALWALLGQQRLAGEVRALRERAELAQVISRVVHELQRERGLAAAYLGSDGQVYAEWYLAQQRQTDTQWGIFQEAAQAVEQARLAERWALRMVAARAELAHLSAWREDAVMLQVSDVAQTQRYSKAIAALVGVVQEMQLLGDVPSLTRAMSAYVSVIQAKEQAGQERALGNLYFAVPAAESAGRQSFLALAGRQAMVLDQTRFFATPEQIVLLDALAADVRQAEIDQYRALILGGVVWSQESVAGELGRWFELMTWRVDQLKQVQDRVAHDLLEAAGRAEQAAARKAFVSGLVVVLVLGLVFALAMGLARGIIAPLRRITQAMNRLAAPGARVGDMEIADHERGDEIGEMARATLVFRDNVVRIAQAGERLQHALALRLYHQALEATAQGVLIVNAQGLVDYCNPAVCAMTGLAAQDILHRPPNFLWQNERERQHLWKDDGLPVALQGRRSGGGLFWYEATVSPVPDGQGTAPHHVVVLRDTTESRHIEQEQRIAATAFESMHGMIVSGRDGRILRVNRAFTEITGYSAQEVVGCKPSMFQSGLHDAQFYEHLWASLQTHGAWFGEIWNRRKSGEVYPLLQSISAVRDEAGQVTHYVAAFADISERKAAEEQIRHLAFYDPLTRLPNRRLLLDRLQHALVLSERTGSHGALMFIDLDQFKSLNDTLGHDVGDLLLVEVARRLQEAVRASDTAARQGGDEFVVMLEDLAPQVDAAASQARAVAEKMLHMLNQPYLLAGHELFNTPSIGVALFQGHKTSLDALMRQADLAMYQSKAAGRNQLHFFDPQMQAAVTRRVQTDTDLRASLQRGDFCLYYQAQVDAQGRTVGAEALLRWQHPQRGLVLPDEFIALAEETGLIVPLGQWVLEDACAQLAQWGVRPETAGWTLAVNVSARQFQQPDFVGNVLTALRSTGANSSRLRLELTESLMLQDVEGVVAKMQALHAHGITFALDDFGTGYSSLAYLRRLPIDVLKIDRSFVRGILTDANDASVAQGIVNLAQSLGLGIVAEGIEQRGQFDLLLRQGCTGYQGFLFGRPAPAHELPLSSTIP